MPYEDFDPEECIEDPEECSGPVRMYSPGRGRAFPRCSFHINKRARSFEDSIERYADSDLAPSWFDPSYAGERWDDD